MSIWNILQIHQNEDQLNIRDRNRIVSTRKWKIVFWNGDLNFSQKLFQMMSCSQDVGVIGVYD